MIKETRMKKLPESEAEISAEISAENFESYRKKAVSELSRHFELPGFRKGKVPENIFLQKVSEMAVLEEMAEMAINDAYPKIIEEHKLFPIGRPEIAITKIAKGNPLCFTIKTALLPEVKLPDYKNISGQIAREKDETEVSEKELADAITEIRKMRAPQINPQPATDNKQDNQIPEPVLPELNDDFVKTLGNFENVSDFSEKLKESIKTEKERARREKKRIKIIDALVEKTEIVLPKIIIEEEKNRLIAQLRHDVERLGLKFDEYLKNINKTEDELRKEWEGEAVKRAKMEFIIQEIADKEKISATDEEISAELKHLLEHNKDADETRARVYISSLLTSQKVMEFLENQGA